MSFLILPEVPNIGQVEFNLSAFSGGRSLELQKFDGEDWVLVHTFTGIGEFLGNFTYDIDQDSPITLRLTSPSAALRVHDIIVYKYVETDQVATPTFDPAGGNFFEPVDVTIETATENATLFYSTESDEGPWTAYTDPIPVNETTTLWAYAEADGLDDSDVVSASYTFPTEVASIEALQDIAEMGGLYRITGEVFLTYKNDSRNQKYFQDDIDGGRGIKIDDPNGNLTTALEVGDGVEDLTGTIGQFNQMIQFTPVEGQSPDASSSTGNELVPLSVTLSEIIDEENVITVAGQEISKFQAMLILVENLQFEQDGDFDSGTNFGVVPISDPTATLEDINDSDFGVVFRVEYADLEYNGDAIPQVPVNLTAIVDQRSDDARIFARDWDDFEFEEPLLLASPSSLSGFTYIMGDGPSDSQSFSLSGSNLDGSDVTITAPENFEVSLDDDIFSGSVNLPEYDGEAIDVWVRLEAGLAVGAYTGDVIIAGGDADEISVSVSGDVTEPPVTDVPFSTDFGIAANWNLISAAGSYGEKEYTEGGWYFYSTNSVRGTLEAELFGDSEYAFRERGVFTVYNLASVSGMTGFRFQLYDWMLDGGVDRNMQISFNGGDTWETVLVINKDWFNEFRVYQPFVYYFAEAQDFDAEEFQIQILNPDPGSNSSRINIGLFEALDTPEPASVEIAGEAGWRMLAAPVTGATVADIAGQNQVQGFTGLFDFYDGAVSSGIESADPNLFLDYDGEEWTPAQALTDELESGKGFIWYMFNNDIGASVPLPFTLTLEGTGPESDVTVALHSAGNGFNLLGNPFPSGLDLSGLEEWDGSDGLDNLVFQVWQNDEPGEGGEHQGVWELFGPEQGEGRTILASWQGFMVENDEAAELVIPVSARTAGGEFLKETAPVVKRLALTLDGINEEAGIRTRDRASLVFSDRADDGWDLLDASQLTPLATSFATLSFVGERNGETILKSQESRPADFEGTLELPASLGTRNMSGEMTITWEGLADLPTEWQFTLVDNETDASVDMRSTASYEFQLEGAIEKRQIEADVTVPEIAPMTADDELQPRFTVIVSSEPVSTETPADLPEKLALAQNYPNPFNPATLISYALPEQTHVRLTVYDMLGRTVSVLVDEVQSPGSYRVNWDATEMTSGVYIYRLEAGGQTLTRSMTLVK